MKNRHRNMGVQTSDVDCIDWSSAECRKRRGSRNDLCGCSTAGQAGDDQQADIADCAAHCCPPELLGLLNIEDVQRKTFVETYGLHLKIERQAIAQIFLYMHGNLHAAHEPVV